MGALSIMTIIYDDDDITDEEDSRIQFLDNVLLDALENLDDDDIIIKFPDYFVYEYSPSHTNHFSYSYQKSLKLHANYP